MSQKLIASAFSEHYLRSKVTHKEILESDGERLWEIIKKFYLPRDYQNISRIYNAYVMDIPPQDKMSLHVKHPLVLVIICTKYEDNPSITADVMEWTQPDE